MKFEREYYVGIKDVGLNNKMSNYGILSCLEEIASSHSDKVGYGVNDIESKKKVWLLMDWKLKVIERPEYGSKIKVETWARPIEKRPFSTYRDFKMFNNGKISAIGTSKWILFDLETNKIAKITEDIIDLYKDVNKHMHNLNYLKLAYEALPQEVYYSKEKDNVRIMYKHQILLGDKVKCYYTNIENKDIITIKSKDDSILHAIVELS